MLSWRKKELKPGIGSSFAVVLRGVVPEDTLYIRDWSVSMNHILGYIKIVQKD